jgi:hypothetical protein
VTVHDGTNAPRGEALRVEALAALAAVRADDGVSDVPALLQRLCRAAAQVLELTGASVHLLNVPAAGGVVAGSDEAARRLGEAAFTAGEGPALDAYADSRPVFAPYLLEEGRHRWPGYVDAVRTSGLRACFSLPLHVGAVRLGVLDLYAGTPGPLRQDQVSLGLTFADLATEFLLDSPPAATADAVNARLVDALERRGEIHQAQGMVMVDLDVDLAEALALMRAHAFTEGLSLLEVARKILGGAHLPSPPDPPLRTDDP